ncbi:MerR family DNA-binding transcriptional regulator [Microbispora sp. KK1-11]|uniref:MerR family DNA-binding transcriptional regulator n=1 Tax=Microbispora sp. KK1-11 TaxID=2053005 RepID=UPI0021AFB628|nr:MerR family DNA-binding transcriptional regulator [Microbispora sp. KK1-11]
MRIGELAALAGVSTRTVRHYHHLGVLPEPPVRYDEKRLVRLAVSSQTNIVVELREPIEAPRPRRPWTTAAPSAAAVRRVRFFADDPAAALRALAALTTTTTGEHTP